MNYRIVNLLFVVFLFGVLIINAKTLVDTNITIIATVGITVYSAAGMILEVIEKCTLRIIQAISNK